MWRRDGTALSYVGVMCCRRRHRRQLPVGDPGHPLLSQRSEEAVQSYLHPHLLLHGTAFCQQQVHCQGECRCVRQSTVGACVLFGRRLRSLRLSAWPVSWFCWSFGIVRPAFLIRRCGRLGCDRIMCLKGQVESGGWRGVAAQRKAGSLQ